MPFVPHTRVSLIGTLGDPANPPETWSCNLSFDVGPFVTQTEADACFTAAAAWISRSTSKISQNAHLKMVKLSSLDTSGHLIGNPIIKTGDASGSDTTRIYPPQIAWVASLTTGQRGASKRGRVFLPLPTGVGVSADKFQVDDAPRVAAEGSFITMVNAMHASLGGGGLVVASRKGYNTTVTKVKFGRVLDTVRSRRRSLVEDYDAGSTLT